MRFCCILEKDRRRKKMFRLEMKRIFSKKINRFALVTAMILAVIFAGFAVTSNRYVKEDGTISTAPTSARKLSANKNQWSGTLTPETLVKAYTQNKESQTNYTVEELDRQYGTLLQPIDDIKTFLTSVLTPESDYDESVLDQADETTIRNIYSTYQENMKQEAETCGHTPVQQKYLKNIYNRIKLPLQYEAYTSWDTMIMYAETYGIILAIIIGFMCAGIFADDFQLKADAVFYATKYGRTKAIKIKILAALCTTTAVYCTGITLLSALSFAIMGTSGIDTMYQLQEPYSIYIMTFGQYYLLTLTCGYIASLLAASLSMLTAAITRTISVAVGIPFFLYCVLPFIGRALSKYAGVFNLMPSILTNTGNYADAINIYQFGPFMVCQIPLVMVLYTVISLLVFPLIYRKLHRYGRNRR